MMAIMAWGMPIYLARHESGRTIPVNAAILKHFTLGECRGANNDNVEAAA